MEANGAVFLPAASYSSGTSLTYVGLYGSYWSSSYSDSNYACCVDFYSGNLYPQSSRSRYCGCSVRLVRNAE